MKEFDKNIFTSPDKRFQDAPFWSWNGKLEAAELERQMETFKEMGFGGIHLHPRTGMDTEYLSDEYMDMVEVCINKAKELDMYIYLYDEDRWPSGFAGGMVTKNPEYRAKQLLFTKRSYEDYPKTDKPASFSVTSHRTGNGELIACYDVIQDNDGKLKSFKQISVDTIAVGDKWYAYLETADNSPWFNGYTNADLLNKDAVKKFLELTHDKYYERFGDLFGTIIPSMFTDEPQLTFKKSLTAPFSDEDVFLAWTGDFNESYKAEFGEDIIGNIPQIIWENESDTRYKYYAHLSHRFLESFTGQYSDWCRKHNLKFTGHFLEGVPSEQAKSTPDVMTMYDYEDIPGVDLLCDSTSVHYHMKPVQSVMHQKGVKQMLCEMYGVNDWSFSFRDYMFQGNWAAACGVNLRAHHLSMYTMAGEGKRDYPASIGYQVPWEKQYKTVEDYFARLNYMLQLGEPIVNIGVINPVESMWEAHGNIKQTSQRQKALDKNYCDIIDWLELGGQDFDFISEELLPKQFKLEEGSAYVGNMHYDAVIVPDCLRLRNTTVDILEKCADNNVKVIYAGNIPQNVQISRNMHHIQFNSYSVLEAVEDSRLLEIRNLSGEYTSDLLYQLRRDGDDYYVYLSSIKKPKVGNPRGREISVALKGEYSVELVNLHKGSFEKLNSDIKNTYTQAVCKLYDFDSVMLRFSKDEIISEVEVSKERTEVEYEIVGYELSEPNVLLLDKAQWQLDDGEVMPCEEILRADNKVRRCIGLETRKDVVTQPWKIKREDTDHRLTLSISFESEIEVAKPQLALECIDDIDMIFNGKAVEKNIIGWYVDRNIKTVMLPTIEIGTNNLIININYTTKTNVEWCYILGDFGVRLCGTDKIITPKPEKIGFGDLTYQGFPFYGGNVTYKLASKAEGNLGVCVFNYDGAVVTASDEDNCIISAPYIADCSKKDGFINLTVYGTRNNTFGAVHNCSKNTLKSHPNSWRTEGINWCEEYVLKPFGINHIKLYEQK